MSHVRSDECVPTLFHHYMRGASTFHLLGFLTWLTKFILPEILSRVLIFTRGVSFYDFIISLLIRTITRLTTMRSKPDYVEADLL